MSTNVEAGIELVRAGELDSARELLGTGGDGERTEARMRADLVLAGAEMMAGAPKAAAAALRRVASGEDPVTGPLASVALSVLDGGERALLPGLAAELTGDLLAARIVYEATPTPLGRTLLGGLLARTGADARARALLAEAAGAIDPLADASDQRAEAGRGVDPLAAVYAGYLLGGLLAGDEDEDLGEAGAGEEALRGACAAAGPGDAYGLLPWAATRLAELLVAREDPPDAIREAAASAPPRSGAAAPAVAGLILGVLDGDPDPVRAALARLEVWSPALYAHGCRVATWLGARLVELGGEPGDHPLAALLGELDASPESAAYARWLRGRGRGAEGDWDAAVAEWERALESAVLPYARWAGSSLSVLYVLRLDEEGAEHALRHGVNAIRIVELGDMFRKAGRDSDARVAYDLALSSDEPGVTSRAWLGLGYVREDDDPSAAADAFRKALELGKGAVAVGAAVGLCRVLKRTGDGDGAVAAAREAHRRCEDEGFSAKLRSLVARELGDLCRERRDWPGATAAYRSCVAAHRELTGEEYPHEARWPLLYLGAVEGLGEEYDASTRNLTKLLEIYAEPEDAEQREITVMAALHLGMNAKFRHDLDTALPWFTRVFDSGDMNHIPVAVAHLAELHYWLGDKAEAARLYERTLEISEDPEFVAEAAYRLSEHLVEATDPVDVPRVIALLERTLTSSFTDFDTDARALLARLSP